MFVIVPVFGFIQFAAMYAEFTYFFDSTFRSQLYAMFGFLTINAFLLMVIISLLSIISTYMSLCYQNYEWQWKSFWVGASGGIYLALYMLMYAFTMMNIKDVMQDLGFFFQMVVMLGCYTLGAGFIANRASYYFVNSIYKDLRSD